MSGAGRIKLDGSDKDTAYEVKDANKQFTLNGAQLRQTFVQAVRDGKDVEWIVYFTDADVTATITVKLGKN